MDGFPSEKGWWWERQTAAQPAGGRFSRKALSPSASSSLDIDCSAITLAEASAGSNAHALGLAPQALGQPQGQGNALSNDVTTDSSACAASAGGQVW